MPRSLSPTFLAQLDSTGASAPVILVVLEFANETVYLFSGIGTFTPAGPAYSTLSPFAPYYGQAFTGVGWLGKISGIPQTTKVQAQSVTLGLNGIVASLVSEAIAQVRVTGTAAIFLGFLNSSGALIPDPLQLFAGALDVPSLEDAGETSTFETTCENALLLLNEAPNRQFDDMDQQIYFPGDLGMSFVDTLGNLALFWPAPADNSTPFTVDMIMSPNGGDIAVGATLTMSVTINYSDTSYKTYPSGAGSGRAQVPMMSSSNPKIATVVLGSGIGDYIVTGVSPGICLIICRTGVYANDDNITVIGERRVACTLIVHS